MHAAPTMAQNVLPVIDDPVITPSPCPSHTAPVKKSSPPMTRLATVTAVFPVERPGHKRASTISNDKEAA